MAARASLISETLRRGILSLDFLVREPVLLGNAAFLQGQMLEISEALWPQGMPH